MSKDAFGSAIMLELLDFPNLWDGYAERERLFVARVVSEQIAKALRDQGYGTLSGVAAGHAPQTPAEYAQEEHAERVKRGDFGGLGGDE